MGGVNGCGNELQKRIQDETGWAPPICADEIKLRAGSVQFIFGKDDVVEVVGNGKVIMSSIGEMGESIWVPIGQISREQVDAMRRIIKENEPRHPSLFNTVTDFIVGRIRRRVEETKLAFTLTPRLLLSAWKMISNENFQEKISLTTGNPLEKKSIR
jgi:hypothetical protein